MRPCASSSRLLPSDPHGIGALEIITGLGLIAVVIAALVFAASLTRDHTSEVKQATTCEGLATSISKILAAQEQALVIRNWLPPPVAPSPVSPLDPYCHS